MHKIYKKEKEKTLKIFLKIAILIIEKEKKYFKDIVNRIENSSRTKKGKPTIHKKDLKY